MSPRHLRGKVGVTLGAMAKALGMTEPSLRILESTPINSWTLAQLGLYLAACRHVLRVTAYDASGHEVEIT